MEVLLTIIATPEAEESIVDWLMLHHHISGFTSHRAYGHGENHDLSATEKVMGTRSQIQFSVLLEEAKYPQIISNLKSRFSGYSMRYWVVPILATGKLPT